MLGMPTLGVGHAEPAQELRKVAVGSRPQNQMPVIGNGAIGQQSHGPPVLRLPQYLFEGRKVGAFVKELAAADSPVENMIGEAATGTV